MIQHRLLEFPCKFSALLCTIVAFLIPGAASAQTITLYQNDFESPNVSTVLACGYALDTRTINTLYGGQGGNFEQVNTVETVLINEPLAFGAPQEYADPEAKGGNYAIGMLSTAQNDRLSLTFDGQGLPFINVGLDISSIDVYLCGGPFGVAAPSYRISLLDSPGGVFNWSNTVLDEIEITGEAAPDQWTFHWTHHVVALDASASTDGNISIVWDLIQSGYGAFDNVIITASVDPGDVTYSVGGTVSGLTGSLTLQNNAGDDLALAADGPFTFATELDDGAQYSVTVFTQPTGQTCTVSNGNGTIAGADVTSVAVDCVDDEVPTYTVGGNISGLTGSVTLQNNGGDDLVVTDNGVFTFGTALIDGSAYAVTILTQPAGQTCVIGNASGTISATNVTNVAVECADDTTIPPPTAGEHLPVPTMSKLGLLLLILSTALVGGALLWNRRF